MSYALLWGGVLVLLCRRQRADSGSIFGGLLLVAFFLFLAGSSQLLRQVRESDSDGLLRRGFPVRGRESEFLGRYSVILLPLACLAVLLLPLFGWRAIPLLALLFLGQWWWFYLLPPLGGVLRRWSVAESASRGSGRAAESPSFESDSSMASGRSEVHRVEEPSQRRHDEMAVSFEHSVSVPFVSPLTQTVKNKFPLRENIGTAADVDSEDSGEYPEEEVDPDCLSCENRYRTKDGQERIEGWIRPCFAPGQDLSVIHLNFTPPFNATPELELFQLAGNDVKLTVTRVEPFGARIEARRMPSGDRDGGGGPERFSDETIRFGFIVQPAGFTSDWSN